MDEVYEGGWLPEVGNEPLPPPKKNNLVLLILGGIAAYYLYKNIK